MDNMTIKAIMERYSERSFDSKPLSDEQLDTLVKAALAAPSAMNRQAYHVTVVKNRDMQAQLEQEVVAIIKASGNTAIIERIEGRGNKIFYNAPVLFVVSAEPATYSELDVGILSQNICIAAQSMGLASIIIGFPRATVFAGEKAEAWGEKLGFPEGYQFSISIAVGYAAAPGGKPHELLSDKVSYID